MRGSLKLSTASLPPGELDASAQGIDYILLPSSCRGSSRRGPSS